MAILDFFSRNRREMMPRRRRRRRLKSLPLLLIFGAIILTFRALITFLSLEVPSTPVDLTIPIEIMQLQPSKDATSSKTISSKASESTINGWQRLKPSHGGTVYGEFDSFTTGKSCRWQPTSYYYPNKLLSWILFASRANFLGSWVCRDCGEARFTSWEQCPLLQPRGKCPSFEYQGWEEPRPRSASTYDPFSSSPYPVRLITSYGVGKVRKVEYEQPQCLSLRKPCFDMDRCTTGSGSERKLMEPIPVFAYPGQAQKDLKDTLGDSKYPKSSIQIVNNHEQACLLIAHSDELYNAETSDFWNLGVNHFVYGVTKPITEGVHYDMAAIGSVVITEAQLRPEYDIPLPLPAIWQLQNLYEHMPRAREAIQDLHRPRKYLLTFKGSLQDTLQPYYQHRWLAAEFLHQEPDVNIDVQCKHKTLWGDTVTFAPYDNPSQDNFDDLMVNSTFAFCPGGSHVTSFRFTEVLSAGAIPVLLPEIVTPFYPEVDWSECVIRVSQTRIIDLPRVLRAIPPEEIRNRQLQCQRLYQTFLQARESEGKKDSTTAGYLGAALKIWRLRLEKQHHGDELANLLRAP